MKYECVDADSSTELDVQINNMIALGWKPQGGVSVSLSESEEYSYITYAQAMIKED